MDASGSGPGPNPATARSAIHKQGISAQRFAYFSPAPHICWLPLNSEVSSLSHIRSHSLFGFSSSSPSAFLNSVLTVQSHQQQQQHQQLSQLSSSTSNMCSLSSALGQIDSESQQQQQQQQQTPCTSTSNGSPSFIKVNSMCSLSLYCMCVHFHVATNLSIGEKGEK